MDKIIKIELNNNQNQEYLKLDSSHLLLGVKKRFVPKETTMWGTLKEHQIRLKLKRNNLNEE